MEGSTKFKFRSSLQGSAVRMWAQGRHQISNQILVPLLQRELIRDMQPIVQSWMHSIACQIEIAIEGAI